MAKDFPIGAHELRYEEPDTMILRWRGAMNADDVVEIGRIAQQLRAEGGVQSCGIVIDAREEGGISAAARKVILDIVKGKFWLATVYFGASFKVRVMIDLIANASRLVIKDAPPLAVVGTEEQARAWLLQHPRPS
jgi:hypothetical protein